MTPFRLMFAALVTACVVYATPEAQVGNVRVRSDVPVVVMPNGGLNPHLFPAFKSVDGRKPVLVTFRDAQKTSRHTLERPSRTVLLEVVVDGRTVEFEHFPFPVGIERGEVYDVPRVKEDFGYLLYLALQMAVNGHPLLTNEDDVGEHLSMIVSGVVGLRRSLAEMPGALRALLPPFLADLEERIREASANCVDALLGKPANLPTRAVRVVAAEQFLTDVMKQVAKW